MGEARRPSSYCASVFVGGSLSDVELIISDVIGTGALRYPWSMRLGARLGTSTHCKAREWACLGDLWAPFATPLCLTMLPAPSKRSSRSIRGTLFAQRHVSFRSTPDEVYFGVSDSRLAGAVRASTMCLSHKNESPRWRRRIRWQGQGRRAPPIRAPRRPLSQRIP